MTILFFGSIADCVKGLVTAYYDNGILIENKKEIVIHYMTKQFKFDLITILPIVINKISFPNINPFFIYFIESLFLCKSFILIKFLKKIDLTFGMREKYETIVDFVKMLLTIFFAAHVMAILYHSVAYIDWKILENDNTWLH